MTPITDLRIMLELGGRSCVVLGRDLPAQIRASLVERLMGSDRQVVHGERGVRGDWGSSSGERNASRRFLNAFWEGKERGMQGGKPSGGRRDEVEALASHLADALDDRKSLRWYRNVARLLPRETVMDALARAKDAPDGSIRHSRAALFTSIVRPLVTNR